MLIPTKMKRLLLAISCALLASTAMVAQEYSVEAGKWSISVDQTTGKATIACDGVKLVTDNEAEWGLQNDRTTFSSLSDIKVSHKEIQDELGTGIQLEVSGTTSGKTPTVVVTHFYCLYSDRDYITTNVVLQGSDELAINYIAPIRTSTKAEILDKDNINYQLYVPFDNDEWVSYSTSKFGNTHSRTYELGALFNNTSRRALVTGSIEHDTWKTGVDVTTQSPNVVTSLCVFNGAADNGTRDKGEPHGAVKARRVHSSKIMLGYFADWRRGLETYADLCATIHPRLPFKGTKPFGWNSWGVIQTKINRTQAVEVSQYYADSLQSKGWHSEDGVVYIGLDSYWDNFAYRDHSAFVRKCKENGQKAGIYWTPFVDWSNDPNRTLPDGTKHSEAWLRDSNGNPWVRTGATAFDPTHPGTLSRIKNQFEQFIKWGYEFVKLDFMIHGILEGQHYDTNVHTGVQAYNQGMQYIIDLIGDTMFINLSIAPLFPAHYAHSRRIACDAYASLDNSEYTLNSTAYGWWLDHCYTYNDADNVVMKDQSLSVNRVRFTSSYITGIVILGDELTSDGDAGAKERVAQLGANNEMVQMAHQTKAFYPVDAADAYAAPNLFMYTVADTTYLAALNYTTQRYRFNVDFDRLGLTTGEEYVVRELWTGDEIIASETYEAIVPRADAAVYKIYPKPANHSVNALRYDDTRCYYDALVEEVRTKGTCDVIESYVYNTNGVCVATVKGAHDSVSVRELPSGVYLYRAVDAKGNNVKCKFVK